MFDLSLALLQIYTDTPAYCFPLKKDPGKIFNTECTSTSSFLEIRGDLTLSLG